MPWDYTKQKITQLHFNKTLLDFFLLQNPCYLEATQIWNASPSCLIELIHTSVLMFGLYSVWLVCKWRLFIIKIVKKRNFCSKHRNCLGKHCKPKQLTLKIYQYINIKFTGREMVISYTSGSSTSNSSIKSKLWYCGKSACQFIFFAKLCSDLKKTWLWIPVICQECIVNGWLPSPRTPVIISMQPPNVAQLCIIWMWLWCIALWNIEYSCS